MATRAKISPGYRWRLGIIGLGMLGFGCWSLYDGFVKYPEQQRMQQTFEQIRADHPENWQAVWTQRAEQEQWPSEQPSKPRSNFDIFTQYIMAGITLPIGLIFTGSFVHAGGRWVQADEAGLSASNGRNAAWDALTRIDQSRWKTKGIAVVYFTASGGGEQHITLDDWKFDRDATGQIYKQVTAHLPGTEGETESGEANQEDAPVDGEDAPVNA